MIGSRQLSPGLFMVETILASDALLLDVRTKGEFDNDGIIEDAINIDYLKSDFEQVILGLDKEAPIMVYCDDGTRSIKACDALLGNGFLNVVSLEGGKKEWDKYNKENND